MRLSTAVALLAIRAYQSWISPHKGFVCAYRVHTGCASCSSVGYRAIQRYGVWQGFKVLRKRTYLCGVAHRRFSAAPPYRPLHQRGECDLGCDAPFDGDCDLRGSRVVRGALDGVGCCDLCSCDFGGKDDRKRNRKHKESDVHIPKRPAAPFGP